MKSTHLFSKVRTVLAWVAVVGCIVSATAAADDDLDRQLLESLEGRREPDSPVTLVNRLLDNIQSARERLDAGQLDEQTKSIQQQILDDMDALLKQMGSAPPAARPSPPSGSAQSQPSGADPLSQSQPEPGEEAAGGAAKDGNEPSTDPNAASRESAERTTPAEDADAERERRLGLATAAWGHLPPKVREQMRSAFSETFLPEYDELVRRYYEALATRQGQRETPRNRRSP